MAKNAKLPIGTTYGCLTIIGGFEEYQMNIAQPKIIQLEHDRDDFLNGIRKSNNNFDSVDTFEKWINIHKERKFYKCLCKCGQIQYLDEFHFLEKRHRYCTHGESECGLKQKNKEKLLASYKRVYDESYYIDYLNTIHESLKIIECIDDNYEKLYCYQDKRKLGGGTYKIYKKYKCKCYICGKELIFISSDFSINPPSAYGARAYGGYYSKAYCDCHNISSFQWIVTKILNEREVPYRVEFSFSDLYVTENTNMLRFDFCVMHPDGSIKCLIECQGEQHYIPVK